MESKTDFFEREYKFLGKHAAMVKRLTANYITDFKSQIFRTNKEILLYAPLVGFLYGRKAELNKDKKYDSDEKLINGIKNEVDNTKILKGEMNDLREQYHLVFSIIMLLDKSINETGEDRARLAFKTTIDNEKCIDLFNQYVRGGIEVLDEKIIGNTIDEDEIVNNLVAFIDEFEERFNESIDVELLRNSLS